MKTFYRVDNGQCGLWYDFSGNFTGLIHSQYDFLTASTLLMPFDNQLVGYISAANNAEHLQQWFTKEEMERLSKSGFKINEFEAEDYKYYEPYQHFVINQATSKLVRTLELMSL